LQLDEADDFLGHFSLRFNRGGQAAAVEFKRFGLVTEAPRAGVTSPAETGGFASG